MSPFVLNKNTYEIEKPCSSGRQANSFIIKDKKGDKFFLKAYKLDPSVDGSRCNIEIESLKLLKGEHEFPQYIDSGIAIVNEVDKKKESFCIITSYIQGAELGDVFESDDSVDIGDRINTYRELLLRVNKLHTINEPIIHRDLKPDNILIHEKKYLYLVDLGLSIKANSDEHILTLCDKRIGPRVFQCPESEVISEDFKSIPPFRFDLYSLGKLLYFFLTKNKDRYGLFPREKYMENPWALTLIDKDLFVFNQVIGAVVTQGYKTVLIDNIESYIELFDKAVSQYYELKANKNLTEKQSLEAMVKEDYNAAAHKQKKQELRLLSDKYWEVARALGVKIEEIFGKIVGENQNNPFSDIGCSGEHFSTISPTLDPRWEEKWCDTQHVKPKAISYLESNNSICVKVYTKMGQQPDDGQIHCSLIVIVTGLNREYKVYPSEFSMPITQTLSKVDIDKSVDNWLDGLKNIVTDTIEKHYMEWTREPTG